MDRLAAMRDDTHRESVVGNRGGRKPRLAYGPVSLARSVNHGNRDGIALA